MQKKIFLFWKTVKYKKGIVFWCLGWQATIIQRQSYPNDTVTLPLYEQWERRAVEERKPLFFADEASIEIEVKETFLQMELQLALLLLVATGVLTQEEDPAAGGEE